VTTEKEKKERREKDGKVRKEEKCQLLFPEQKFWLRP